MGRQAGVGRETWEFLIKNVAVANEQLESLKRFLISQSSRAKT